MIDCHMVSLLSNKKGGSMMSRPPFLPCACTFILRTSLELHARTNIVMATSIHCCFTTATTTTTSFSANHPILKKPQINPFHKTSNFCQKPINLSSLKEICKQGNLKEAFQLFTKLLAEQNPPQNEAYSSILGLCASKKALSQGKQIHAHLITSCGLSDSVFLGTKLVFMYGKCGSLSNAEKVFDRMTYRTVFTWNAIIGAYITNGEFLAALESYREMRVSGENPDACTFPCVLKACGGLKDMLCGEEIHGLAIKFGYDSVVFVVNSLVSMYAKCNDLTGARQLFDMITEREDAVSWNSMITAYSANGQSIEALSVFREMQKAGLATDTYTFVAALQACEESSFEKSGMEIHAAFLKSAHFLDGFVANALIGMYARCGRMSEAANIFYNMDARDNISWNSMLSGLVQNALYSDALWFLQDMLGNGQKPDQVSVISIVSASGRLGNLLNGMEAHAYAIKNRLDSDLQVGNTLIDMYSKCCSLNYMDRVFYKMPNKDFISWTTVIAGYAQNNCCLRALELFREVQLKGMAVGMLMIGSILLACSGLKSNSYVKEIHGYIMRRGISDLVLQNTIVDVYGECGNIDYATRMFELIESKDVVSWTSMISCYVHNGLANEALELFNLMKKARIEPDYVALVSILSAAASLSALKKGKETHGFIIKKGIILEGSIASSLVDMYARCGTCEDSFKVFTCIKNKNLAVWTSMINAYGMHGRGKAAIDLFKRMEDENLVPDHITFLALLNACSHSGLIHEGKRFLETMKYDYELEPWPDHYACLVDLLGRANHLEEAYRFVKSMQIEPTAEVWCALLGACRIYSNKELGDIAAQKLLELNPENPGNYVLVSNMFASSGRWKDVEELRMRMKGNNIMKNPGCSWIEVGNTVHTFMARDRSHTESHEIYQKLAHITKELERGGGYVPQTKFVLHNVEEEEKVKMLYGHSERLAIAYGLLKTCEGTPIRISKNLRCCGDCHTFCKLISKVFRRELVVRDANRFHHFGNGVCSCGDFW